MAAETTAGAAAEPAGGSGVPSARRRGPGSDDGAEPVDPFRDRRRRRSRRADTSGRDAGSRPGRHGSGTAERSGFAELFHVWAPLLLVPGLLMVLGLAYSGFGRSAPTSTQLLVAGAVGLVVGGAAWAGLVPRSWVGVVGWAGICCGFATVALHIAAIPLPALRGGVEMLAVTSALVVAGRIGGDVVHRRRSGREAVRDVAAVLTEPARPFAATLLGAGLGVPLLGVYAPILADSDSMWLAVSTQEVHEHGIGLIEQNQEVLLPHLVIGPLLRLGGYELAVPFTILTMLALAGLTAYLTQRITGSAIGALAAPAALLAMSEVTARTPFVPMYATCFMLAYGGGWLVHRAMGMKLRDGGWWRAIVGGLMIVGSVEAHAIGQLYYLVPFLLLILHPLRRALRPFAVTLATMLVASIPRIVINHAVGGFSSFRSNRTDYLVQKGYLDLLNREFWNFPNTGSPISYLKNLPGLVNIGANPRLPLLLAVPILVAAMRTTWRPRLFVAACTLVFIAALAIASPAVVGRYLTPLAVGAALLVGVGVAVAARAEGEGRTVAYALVAVLLVATFIQERGRLSVELARHERVEASYSPRFAAVVGREPVLGVRSHELLWTRHDVHALFARNMSEEDFVTYLTWPSDEQVYALMDRLGVEYVLLGPERSEKTYYDIWVKPAYGREVRHPEHIRTSPRLCPVTTYEAYTLYRYGPCEPGDLGR